MLFPVSNHRKAITSCSFNFTVVIVSSSERVLVGYYIIFFIGTATISFLCFQNICDINLISK